MEGQTSLPSNLSPPPVFKTLLIYKKIFKVCIKKSYKAVPITNLNEYIKQRKTEVEIINIGVKIKKTLSDGQLVTEKCVPAFYVYIFYSGSLRCNFRFVEPGD